LIKNAPHQTLQKFDQKCSAENFLLKERFIEERRAFSGKKKHLSGFQLYNLMRTKQE